MEIKKIVVAYDGSSERERALNWAIDLAGKLRSDVVVVSVVKPPEFSPTISEIEEFYEDGEKHFRPLLNKVEEKVNSLSISLRVEILRGHPTESIVRYAFDRRADLVAMGTRGTGGFKSLIIGSVAQKVVTYSKVPVVVIK
ncbi:universal stress protein [Sporomusaceae bacterium FL31]|nr:universal stress protein [Sporomusaceae bacterium FL31]GCE33567.1 universal stress protein [Sporomusaceae bacterium]